MCIRDSGVCVCVCVYFIKVTLILLSLYLGYEVAPQEACDVPIRDKVHYIWVHVSMCNKEYCSPMNMVVLTILVLQTMTFACLIRKRYMYMYHDSACTHTKPG